jgi:hypothetical protein
MATFLPWAAMVARPKDTLCHPKDTMCTAQMACQLFMGLHLGPEKKHFCGTGVELWALGLLGRPLPLELYLQPEKINFEPQNMKEEKI